MSDFIEVYPNALDRGLCEQIIAAFESSGQAKRGQTGSGVDTTLKDSYDINLGNRSEWQQIDSVLKGAVFERLRDYVRKYRFLLIGPLALRVQDQQSGEIQLINEENFSKLNEVDYTRLLLTAFRS